MNKSFVPLVAPTGGPTPLRPKPATEVAAAVGPEKAFRPVHEALATAAAAPPHASVEPKITLERDGERVTRIIVQCPCGHTIDLACAY